MLNLVHLQFMGIFMGGGVCVVLFGFPLASAVALSYLFCLSLSHTTFTKA